MALNKKMSAAQKLVLEYYKAKLSLMHVINARWATAAAIDLFQKPYARPRQKQPPVWKHAQLLKLTSGKEKLTGYYWKPQEPNGKKMLIVHGFAGRCQSFEKYIAPALHRGYEVIAYDAPAHGKSSGSRINVLSYSWALQDIIHHHGAFDAYLAHSLGGMSLLLAMEHLQVKQQHQLVLIAPLIEADTAATSFFNFLQLPLGLRKDFLAELEAMAGHPMSWFSLPRLLQSQRAKVLWVHDKFDDTTPFSGMAHLVDAPPQNVEIMVTEGLGHSRIYRDNKVRKRVVEFLF